MRRGERTSGERFSDPFVSNSPCHFYRDRGGDSERTRDCYREVFETSRDGYVLVDPSGRIIDANPAFCKMVGYSLEELREMAGITEITPKRWHDWERRTIWNKRLLVDGYSGVFEKEYIRKDGSVFPVELQAHAVFDEAGTPEYMWAVIRDVTEQKAALEALRESEERFRTIYEWIPIGVAQVSLDFRVERANAAYCRMLGYEESELIGKHLRDFAHPETLEANLREQARLARGEIDHYRMEKKFVHKDGRTIHGILGANLIRDAHDAPAYFLGTVVDVTERKRAGDALRASEAKFRGYIESSPDPIFVSDGEGRFQEVNPAACKLLGFPAEELTRLSVPDIVAPEEIKAAKEGYKRAREKGSAGNERTLIDKDGNRIHLAIDAARLPDGHIIAFGKDITQRKKAEEALRASEHAFRTVVENANDIIYSVSLEGIVLYLSPKWEHFMGIPAKECVGRSLDVYVHPEDVPRCRRALSKLARGKREDDLQYRVRAADGSWRKHVSNVSPLLDEDGRVISVVGIAQDVTERERAEYEKAQLEEQYRHAQKMQAIGQLTGGVAHDFNNLLLVINGYTELASFKLPEDHAARKWLDEVAEAGNRAARLVEQLLLFSRRRIMQLENLSLNGVVSGVLSMLDRVIGEDIRLDFIPGPQLGTVRADRGMIEQIVMNLGVNARDAMPKGGKLTIETANVDVGDAPLKPLRSLPPGSYVMLRVSDTGCGMAPETMQHIFEPFFTTKEVGKGTGLGLATAYGIVQQHKGTIRVESRLGAGTTFRVLLPLVEEEAAQSETKAKPETAGGTETILLAEDNEMVRDFTVEMLQGAGYRLLTANDGEEAISLFEAHRDEIDLLLLDIVMPRMGGIEAWQRISERHPGIPVLFASGYSESALRGDSIEEEDLVLVQKPFKRDELLSRIRAVLS